MAGAFANTGEIYEYIESDTVSKYIQIVKLIVSFWSLARLKASGGQTLKLFQIRSN